MILSFSGAPLRRLQSRRSGGRHDGVPDAAAARLRLHPPRQENVEPTRLATGRVFVALPHAEGSSEARIRPMMMMMMIARRLVNIAAVNQGIRRQRLRIFQKPQEDQIRLEIPSRRQTRCSVSTNVVVVVVADIIVGRGRRFA
nr:hypothetical protein Iba_chr10aCG5660 [Ipomoea batatas]